MCIQHIATFGQCGHTSEYVETEGCPTKDCANPPKQKSFYKNEACLKCIGEAYRYGGLFYKVCCQGCLLRCSTPSDVWQHCYKSTVCNHEYDHALTDADRHHSQDDIVLVTPVLHQLCPDCEEKGYDDKPGGTNPPPMTASIVPRDFLNLDRVEGEAITLLNPDGISVDGHNVNPSNSSSSRRTPSKPPPASSIASTLRRNRDRLRTSTKPASTNPQKISDPSAPKPALIAPQKSLGPSTSKLNKITNLAPIPPYRPRGSRKPPSPLSNTPETLKPATVPQSSSSTAANPPPSQAQQSRVRFALPLTRGREHPDLERRMEGLSLRSILKRSSAASVTPSVGPEGTSSPIPPQRNQAGNSVYPRVNDASTSASASASRRSTRNKGKTQTSTENKTEDASISASAPRSLMRSKGTTQASTEKKTDDASTSTSASRSLTRNKGKTQGSTEKKTEDA